MAFSIGAGISLTGEKDFRQAVSAINKDLSVLSSEMTKTSAQFGKNADSMDALTVRGSQLQAQYDAQAKKVEVLRAALEHAKEQFGENSTQAKNWEISLNRAEAQLANTGHAIEDNNAALEEMKKESAGAGDAAENLGKQAKNAGEKAEQSGEGWKKLSYVLGGVGKAMAAAAAAVGAAASAAAAGIFSLSMNAAEAADEINTLSKLTDLSTEQIQKFQFASEQIDVSFETLSGSMVKLKNNMQSARDGSASMSASFEKLGVTVANGDGSLRDANDVFGEAISALGRIENATERDALAMDIFGKSATDLNPLILGGAEALEELGQQAEQAGVILSQDSLDSLNTLTDATDTFKATLTGTGRLFATAFAQPIAAGVNDLTASLSRVSGAFQSGGFAGAAEAVGTALSEIMGKVSEYLPRIMEAGMEVLSAMGDGIMQNLPLLLDTAMELVRTLSSYVMDALPELLTAAMEIILTLADGIAAALPELIPTLVDTVLYMVETMIDNVDKLIDAAIAIIGALANGLIDALPRLLEKAPEIIVKLVDAFTENMPKIVQLALELMLQLAAGLIKAIPQLLIAVPKIIGALVDSFAVSSSQIVDIGKNIVEGIWNGIKSTGSWLQNKFSGWIDDMVDSVKSTLGIASPSKVFAGIGRYMAQGLGSGFESELQSVKRQMDRAVPKSLDIAVNQYQGKGSGATVIQYNTYQSPKDLSPAEAARKTRLATRKAALALRGG